MIILVYGQQGFGPTERSGYPCGVACGLQVRCMGCGGSGASKGVGCSEGGKRSGGLVR